MILDHVNINRDIDDISMYRGDTLAFAFEVTDVEGNDAEIEQARFTVKESKSAENNAFQLTLHDGIEPEGAGVYSVRVRPDLTANLEPNTYYYTLKIISANDSYTIQQGKLIIKKGEQ